ncbi:hypothetical protein LBMAG56_32670 [Verrucomicrobiota bacterium]|nr:hypothetical protein LBMAG56_32670 [Verrucomicrobiota bacterium]
MGGAGCGRCLPKLSAKGRPERVVTFDTKHSATQSPGVALPIEFNEAGDLPPGIHRGSLSEVLARFGHGSAQRQEVARRLETIYRLVSNTGQLRRFIVFGSFITRKAEPNDVDVFLVMQDAFDVGHASAQTRQVFEHMAAHDLLGASVFWVPAAACEGDETAMLEHWQIKRDGSLRGIVEIVPA